MKNFKPFIKPIIYLAAVDQLIKIIISTTFMQNEFNMIDQCLRFKPTLNTDLSWAGNYIEIFSNPIITVLANVLVIFLFLTGYMLYKTKRETTSAPVNIIMICGLAGCFCSLIDKLFWGGSLDFLQIPGLFIFDLKDCYLTIAEVLFVIIGIPHSKEISIKEYVQFCYQKFTRRTRCK